MYGFIVRYVVFFQCGNPDNICLWRNFCVFHRSTLSDIRHRHRHSHSCVFFNVSSPLFKLEGWDDPKVPWGNVPVNAIIVLPFPPTGPSNSYRAAVEPPKCDDWDFIPCPPLSKECVSPRVNSSMISEKTRTRFSRIYPRVHGGSEWNAAASPTFCGSTRVVSIHDDRPSRAIMSEASAGTIASPSPGDTIEWRQRLGDQFARPGSKRGGDESKSKLAYLTT